MVAFLAAPLFITVKASVSKIIATMNSNMAIVSGVLFIFTCIYYPTLFTRYDKQQRIEVYLYLIFMVLHPINVKESEHGEDDTKKNSCCDLRICKL